MSRLSASFSIRPIAVTAIVYAIFAIGAIFLPPFNTLGYEFSGLSGLVAAAVGGVSMLAHFLRSPRSNPREVLAVWLVAILAQLGILLIPLGIMTFAAFFIPNCSMLAGALFYLLIPCMTVVFVSALAMFLASTMRPWIAYAAYVTVSMLLLVHPILQVLTQPQLYAYNHIFGLFVGFSWDEAQPVVTTLLFYRVLSLAYAVLLLIAACVLSVRGEWSSQPARFRGIVLALLIVSSAVIACGFFFSDELGFSTTTRYLEQELGAVVATDHFRIVYSKKAMTAEDIARVAEEHEFRLAQVCRELRIRWTGIITSYIYPDAETKRRLLGTESSQISRPWMHEIHISADGVESALKHELVHAVGAMFGPLPVRVPILRHYGLTEGLAMAVEWDWGNRSLHEYAAGLLAQGLLPPVRELITTGGFFSQASSRGYVCSGSFCRWLIDRKGIELFKRCYSSDDLESVYATTLESLDAEYREFLRGILRPLPDSLAIRYLFSSPPLQKKICARALTEINRAASAAYSAGDYRKALSTYRQSEALYSNRAAAFGIVASSYRLGDFRTAIREARAFLDDERRRATVAPILLTLGNAAWRSGDSVLADSCYSVLIEQRITGQLTSAAQRRRMALRSPAIRAAMMDAYDRAAADTSRRAGFADIRFAFAADSAHPLARFELGARLVEESVSRQEGERLLLGVEDSALAYDAMMTAARSVYERDRAASRPLFLKARADAPNDGERRRAEDWTERSERRVRIR
jgi:hypothetical protein